MSDANIVFANIVATPTLNAWSQAYNAGRLFAVLSLKREDSTEPLGALGKEILNSLEEEYFTLETKNLTTIKQAIEATCKKIPEDVTVSFVVASIIGNVTFIYVVNNGKVVLKRDDRIGTILDTSKSEESIDLKIASASGFLQNGDYLLLETEKFTNVISKETLSSSFDHNTPVEIAEILSPTIHEKEEGEATAIILSYKNLSEETETPQDNLSEELSGQEEIPQNKEPVKIFSFLKEKISHLNLPSLKLLNFKNSLKANFSHSKKMFITLAVVIIFILLSSIYFAVKKQQDAKTQALFQEVFSKAQKKYDEGNALLGLNKNLAKDDLLSAQKTLEDAKTKFKKASKEEKQLNELAKQINDALTVASAVNLIQPEEASEKDSTLLSYELKNPGTSDNPRFFAQDSKTIYFADKSGVSLVDKSTAKTKLIITNKSDWTQIGGIGLYFGNVYILDKKSNQIIKYVASDDGFGKTNYLKSDVSIDFSKASDMAIDTSAWVVLNDGSVKKFTRGKQDTFSLSGLDNPLSNPFNIFTDTSTDNLYILDKDNSRIVVFNKEGVYQAQYQANIFKNATDFEVLEKDKNIFILSEGKIWKTVLK